MMIRIVLFEQIMIVGIARIGIAGGPEGFHYIDYIDDVQIKLRVPIGNQRNFAGSIVGMRGDAAAIVVEGEEREFPLEGIEKARLVPKF